MERAAAIALLVGCYQPAPSPGAPCPDGVCPAGQRCIAGTCRAEGEPIPDDARPPDARPDATIVDAAPDAPGAWSAPVPIPGVNSTDDDEDPSLTADRLTIVFASDRPGGLGLEDLYLGTRTAVTEPFVVAAIPGLSSAARELSPEISADGNSLYFTSDRDGDDDIFLSVRTGNLWSAPQRVNELSSGSNDGDVAISPDGLTALVSRSTGIYLAMRASTSLPFGQLTLVPVLDITGDVAAPSLTNGAAIVFLHGGTTRDLYVAYKQGATFTTPMPITELNTAGRDAGPFISANGARLVFEREGDLYESTR